MEWGSGAAELGLDLGSGESEELTQAERIRRGMAVMRKLDMRLMRLHQQARELRANAESGASQESEGEEDAENSGDAGALSLSRASTGSSHRPSAAVSRVTARTSLCSAEDSALVDELMAQDSEEEEAMAMACYPSDVDAARLDEINAALRAYAPDDEWEALSLTSRFGDATSRRTSQMEALEAAQTTATGKRDYLREARVNREQRDRLFAVERSLRELATLDDENAAPSVVRALLLDAIAEQTAAGTLDVDELDPDAFELISAEHLVDGGKVPQLRKLTSAAAPLSLQPQLPTALHVGDEVPGSADADEQAA
ncbi:uncharacterized protein AMSG_02735 [Thecamonas trahens ATCC 50062]|uniref:Fibrous sheath-interacting protein 1 n=1 Tax=Thecamonas trahens ATCC 50062 TaxID=461836 RepID=A0A0L0D1Y3_THETB|nr:hypothetical protein AMSG_02735 [Thecamonas trahens ATCC 50062]KNC46282.1 hypothetical protein AMSG_02735 [Thecamonas trahens ATCC 50062]|eukprot:XP_013760576.1 hypothetical protein AMSG_02735 [Thecamonas trahens ATCC 50062]